MKNSPYSEIELLEIASKFKKHLKNHFSSIKSVCPGLDQDFIYRFKALYYEAQTHPLETQSDSFNQVFNLELKEFADQVRGLFPILRFYLNKAFPYDSNLWEAYGYCEIEKVVQDFSTLRKCIEGAVNLIHEKRSELKAVNCPEPTLDEIVCLSKRIADKHDELLEYLEKKEIRKTTYESRLNELFQLIKIVQQAASKSLQNDPESLKHWSFLPKEFIQKNPNLIPSNL